MTLGFSHNPPMATPSDIQVNQLRVAIDTLVRRFKIAESVETDGPKLNPIDLQALFFVADHPRCTASEVAQHLGVVATTMSAVIDRLVRHDLLMRARVSSNRRIVSLTLTEQGRRQVDAAIEAQNEHSRAMLSALDEQERADFIKAFTKIIASP